jgi:hypothetical protein
LPEQDSHVMVVVNLDPFQPHESTIEAPYHVLGIPPDAHIQATELFSNSTHIWQGTHQTVYLDPKENPANIFSLKVWQQKDYEEPCF